MRRTVLCLAVAALCGCPRAAQRSPAQDARTPRTPAGLFRVDPELSPAVRLRAGHFLHGSLRRTEGSVAPAPRSATALVAAAELADGWLFAAADGTLYRAPSFLGAWTVAGAVPSVSTRAAVDPTPRRARAVYQRGALAFVDRTGGAWACDGAHAPFRMPLAQVLSAAFVDARTVLAVTEPGVLQRSDDGGRSFRVEPVPGVALNVALVDDRVLVATTEHRYRWTAPSGPLTLDDEAPSLLAALTAGTDALAPADVGPTAVLPPTPGTAAARADGSLVVAVAGVLRTVDVATGREVRRTEAPGAGCSLHRGGSRLYAVCTHQGWARAVFAERAPDTWTVLRDELRAEPLGDLAFDDASAAWAVAAPCTQRTVADPRALCLYDAQGERRDLEAPFDATVVAMHDGEALVVETSPEGGSRRGGLARGSTFTPLELPLSRLGAATGRFLRGRWSFWEPGAPPTLVTAAREGTRWTWTRTPAPAGALYGFFRDDGGVFAVGLDGSQLWSLSPDGRFVAVTGLVDGAPATLSLRLPSSEHRPHCAGAVCSLAPGVEWIAGVEGPAPVVTRRDVPAVGMLAPPRPLHRIRCAHGATSPGAEVDHGIAVSGFAMGWSIAGRSVTVRFEGDTVRGVVQGALPPPRGAITWVGHGLQGAESTAGLLESCDASSCLAYAVSPRGLRPLPLFAEGDLRRADLSRGATGHLLARAMRYGDGQTVVQVFSLDAATGQPLAQRTFATRATMDLVYTGELDGRDGVFLQSEDGALRFVPLEGAAVEGTWTGLVPETTFCPAQAVARGVARSAERANSLAGEGWRVEPGEWQSEVELALVGDRVCIRAYRGGEARDEAELERAGHTETATVRSFIVTAQDERTLTGTAWGHRQRIALRCQ